MALVCVLLAVTALPVSAKTRAILVGVSDYEFLDADLKGPRNDVKLMAAALAERGIEVEDIAILSEDSKAPTRTNILAALDKVAAQSVADDLVIFYFSGHGSQMPDLSGDELLGYDEIFLPSDAKSWRGSIGAVENAIIDDELRERAQAIMAKGAALVAIVDACHSATGFRALPSNGTARYLDPSILAIPSDAPGTSAAPASDPLTGNFAFFYSSQSDQRSFEYPVGDADDPANWYGEFTRNLVNVLNAAPALTYGGWLQATKDGMRRETAVATQTPDGEGTLLDQPVFWSASVGPQRMRVEASKLQSGLLSDLNVGAIVDIYVDALADTPLGRAEISAIAAKTATLEPLDGLILPPQSYASMVSPGHPQNLRLSVPVAHDDRDYSTVHDALALLASEGSITTNATTFDAGVILEDGFVVLTGPDGVVDASGPASSIRLPIGDAHRLAETLLAYARVHRLRTALALAEKAASGGFSFGGAGVTVSLETKAGSMRQGRCTKRVANAQPLDGSSDVLKHCDQLWVRLTNSTAKNQDVTVLYVDKDFAITALWPQNGISNRLAVGEAKSLGFRIDVPDNLPGQEELIVLSVAAGPEDPRTVLTALAAPTAQRSVAAGSTESYLKAATDPAGQSRSFSLKKKITPLSVNRFGFGVAPQPQDD